MHWGNQGGTVSRLKRRVVALIAALALAAIPISGGAAGGFNGPLFGLATAPNGAILVADASTGIIPIRNDIAGEAIPIPGATAVSPIRGTSMWVTTGAGGDPTLNTGQALHQTDGTETRMIVDLYEFEASVNPDGNDPFDSNPYDVASLGSNAALVVDAGGNDLLQVNRNGSVHVLAVFPDELVSTANIKALAGCPESGADFCFLPEQIPGQAVPTSVAIGPDGYYYVGELKGFPGPTGESNIWRVHPRASWAECGSSPDCVKVFDGGFTSIVDLAFDPKGTLYVVELDEASWAAVEIFGVVTGGTLNACNVHTLACDVVAGSIPMLTAVTLGNDRSIWVTQNSLIPGAAEVVQLP
ncbi:MAG: ScyD/ScyE family protein [Actinobacteria bacterium]|nr:MAG: ScyD/ScyE family protein [Actinomycetota bacterium]